MKPPLSDRGPSRLRGRSHFGAAKARSAAVWLVEMLRNVPDQLDRATCCGRGPPALRWECPPPLLQLATRGGSFLGAQIGTILAANHGCALWNGGFWI